MALHPQTSVVLNSSVDDLQSYRLHFKMNGNALNTLWVGADAKKFRDINGRHLLYG